MDRLKAKFPKVGAIYFDNFRQEAVKFVDEAGQGGNVYYVCTPKGEVYLTAKWNLFVALVDEVNHYIQLHRIYEEYRK